MSAPPQASSQLDQVTSEREEAARRYVEQLRAFRIHAAMHGLSMLVIISVNLYVNLSAGIVGEWSAWWSVWALIGWGIGIGVHGLVVWLNRPSLDSLSWEERQVEKLLGR